MSQKTKDNEVVDEISGQDLSDNLYHIFKNLTRMLYDGNNFRLK
jgi:hypothetical protein